MASPDATIHARLVTELHKLWGRASSEEGIAHGTGQNLYYFFVSDCGCKALLNEQNIPYEEINIEDVNGAVDIVMQANQRRRSVPTLDIGGQFVTCSPFDRRKLS